VCYTHASAHKNFLSVYVVFKALCLYTCELFGPKKEMNIGSICSMYPGDFERAFPIDTVTGNLTGDGFISEWYNAHLDFIQMFTSVRPPALMLEEPPRRDIQLTRAYVYAYTAYKKVCCLWTRQVDPMYTQWLYVDDSMGTPDAVSKSCETHQTP
jgi:hypothetical protein